MREYTPSKFAIAGGAGADLPPKRPLAASLDIDLDSEMPNPSPVFAPNRRAANGIVVEGRVVQVEPARLTERALAAHDGQGGGVHPFLYIFTSPIGACALLGVGCTVADR